MQFQILRLEFFKMLQRILLIFLFLKVIYRRIRLRNFEIVDGSRIHVKFFKNCFFWKNSVEKFKCSRWQQSSNAVDGNRIHVEFLTNCYLNSNEKSRWLHLISSLVNFGLVCFSLNKLPNMEDLAFFIFFPEFFLWNSFPVTESSEIETLFEISILATWIRQSYSVQEFKIGSDSKNRKK